MWDKTNNTNFNNMYCMFLLLCMTYFPDLLPNPSTFIFFWTGGTNPSLIHCLTEEECRGRFQWSDGTHIDPAVLEVYDGNEAVQFLAIWRTSQGAGMRMSDAPSDYANVKGYLCQWDCGRINQGKNQLLKS